MEKKISAELDASLDCCTVFDIPLLNRYSIANCVVLRQVQPPIRDYIYQAGVRQVLQDEDGAEMSMKVDEKRQFLVPLELAFKAKAFGEVVPQYEEVSDIQISKQVRFNER